MMLFCLITLALLSTLIVFAESAFSQTPFTLVETAEKDLRVTLTLFGLKNQSGDITIFVEASNQTTRSSILDPLELDTKDNSTMDGVGEYGLVLANSSLSTGDEYRLCVLVTQPVNLICENNLKSPSDRREFVSMDISHE